MEGIALFCTLSDMGAEFNLRRHVLCVISVRVIIRKIEIAIFEKAVRDEKIVRLISGKSLDFRNHQS
jgi:hypothetical protein